jgi:hypothetical protein
VSLWLNSLLSSSIKGWSYNRIEGERERERERVREREKERE